MIKKILLPVLVGSICTPCTLIPLVACGSQLSYDFALQGSKTIVLEEGQTEHFFHFVVQSKSSKKVIVESQTFVLSSSEVHVSKSIWNENALFVTVAMTHVSPPIEKQYDFDMTMNYLTSDEKGSYKESVTFTGFSITYKKPASKGSIDLAVGEEKDKTIKKSTQAGEENFASFKFSLSQDCPFSMFIYITFDPNKSAPNNLVFLGSNPSEFTASVEREKETDPWSFNVKFKFKNEQEQKIGEKVEFSGLVFKCSADGRTYSLKPETVLSVTLVEDK